MTDSAPSSDTAVLAGRTVNRIGFGAMQLGHRGPLPAPPRDIATQVLRTAVSLGMNHIDTAEFYGDGAVNELIRSALAPYPDDLVLVSKVGAESAPGRGLVPSQRPAQLRAGVEANLRSLGVDRLDVVNLRRVDTPPGIVAEGDQVVDLDSQLAELVALREEGKIGGIGLSTVSLDQLQAALPAGIVCVQNSYSLLDRSGEGLLELCRDNDIAWVPYFPLGSAFPGMPKVTEQPAVLEVAARLRVTPAQVGLAWLLQHDAHVLLIPGTSNPDHLRDNLAVDEITLDDEAMRALDGVASAVR